MKRAGLLLALLFGIAAAGYGQTKSTQPTKQNPPATTLNISSASKSVVSVIVYDKSGKALAQGSGFFVERTGKLITNFHVIEGAASVVVKSSSGAFYPVKGILGVDKQNDIAVLKVAGNDFAFLPLGDSDAVQVGDRVLAIGSPLGLEETISDGLISGIRDSEKSTVFQTTAAVSPGSSGGVLLNSKGEVIGITSFQLTSGQNLNFAVPVKYVRPLLKSVEVMAFVPSEEAPVERPKPSAKAVALPSDLPRDWTNLEDGSAVSVRVDGEYIYEQGKILGDGQYIKEGTYICEMKREGDRWVGKCRYRVLLVWASAITQNWCNISLDETISLINRSRIEGESQEAEPASNPQKCPQAGSVKSHFALIPKY